jgi:hypothetical protein
VRIGKRAGQEKRTNSHAKRLRTALMSAGVFRLSPVEVRHVGKGRRTDLAREATATKLAPDPRDPLYFETEVSLPVDFHSFRRAFNTALAEAGVNVQRAMHLASHSDPRVHHRYVMRTKAMQQIPAEALPQLPVGPLPERPTPPRIVLSGDDSREEGEPRSKILSDSSRRDWCRTSDPYRVKPAPGVSRRYAAFRFNELALQRGTEASTALPRGGVQSGARPIVEPAATRAPAPYPRRC